MDDLEIEGWMSPLDDVRPTPPDVSARIRSRALGEVVVLPEPGASSRLPRSRRLLVGAGIVAASVAAIAGVGALRDADDETVQVGDGGSAVVDIDTACAAFAASSDQFALLATSTEVSFWTTEDTSAVREAAEAVVVELGEAGLPDSGWPEFVALLAQADRDAAVGDLESARAVLVRAQLSWFELVQSAPSSVPSACKPE